jgi:hypothetical protein
MPVYNETDYFDERRLVWASGKANEIMRKEINPVTASIIIVVVIAVAAGVYFVVNRKSTPAYDPKKEAEVNASRGIGIGRMTSGSAGAMSGGSGGAMSSGGARSSAGYGGPMSGGFQGGGSGGFGGGMSGGFQGGMSGGR